MQAYNVKQPPSKNITSLFAAGPNKEQPNFQAQVTEPGKRGVLATVWLYVPRRGPRQVNDRQTFTGLAWCNTTDPPVACTGVYVKAASEPERVSLPIDLFPSPKQVISLPNNAPASAGSPKNTYKPTDDRDWGALAQGKK